MKFWRSLHPSYVRLIKNTFLGLLAMGIFGIAIIAVWISTIKIPNLDSFEGRLVTQSTKIYDRTGGVLLYDLSKDIHRTVVPIEEISKNIKNATIAVEDKNFYQHHGIEISSTIRAILANITNLAASQGGSTITQQVVKNALLTTDKLISRKLKEWILAPQLEKVLTKDQILGIYLNENPYGGSLYGVEEASQAFFGKKAADVDLAESAYIAAMPQAPTYYSPYGQHKNELDKRKNFVLSEMFKEGLISEKDYSSARGEVVNFKPQNTAGIKAPHFVMFVKEYLENKYGADLLAHGGLKIITTLDYSLEQKAEAIVKKYALQNQKSFNASNGALVAIDPNTGQILTMVGSRDYFDKEIPGNFNVATAFRQPGSAFKPFIYAEAFNKGYTPDTILFDLPTEFSTFCTPDGNPIGSASPSDCYMPGNYEPTFAGPVTMKNALAQSINIPAIKAFYLAGMTDSLNLSKSMGITSLGNINRYGLTLVLGGGEVSLLDMTSAYGVFANNGVRNPYTAILEVADNKGNILEKFSTAGIQVLPVETAEKISDILSDNVARIPLYGANSPLFFPNYDVAAKTGTTNNYRDAWTIGYTPTIVVGAWAGNNDNTSMEKKVSGLIVAPFWNAFMQEVLPQHNGTFSPPPQEDTSTLKPVLRGEWRGEVSNLNNIFEEQVTNLVPTPAQQEPFWGGIHSILYWVNKSDPRGPIPVHPENDPQFNLWEYPVQKWVAQNNIVAPTTFFPPPINPTYPN